MEATFKLFINELDSTFLDKIKTVFPQRVMVEIKISNEYDETDYFLKEIKPDSKIEDLLPVINEPIEKIVRRMLWSHLKFIENNLNSDNTKVYSSFYGQIFYFKKEHNIFIIVLNLTASYTLLVISVHQISINWQNRRDRLFHRKSLKKKLIVKI